MLFFYLIAFLLRFLVISLSIFFARSVTYFYTLLLLLIDSLRTYSKMLANFLFTLYFSVLLCWISSSIGHVLIYTPSFLIIRLEFTKKYLVNVFTFENLLFSACFRSLWMAFVCSLLLSVKLQCFTLLRRFKKTPFYSWVFLSISFVFLSIVSRFLCNFLDVMQFSRCNSIASLFGNFFEHLLRSFSHVFLYAPSLAHWFSSNFLKNACNMSL